MSSDSHQALSDDNESGAIFDGGFGCSIFGNTEDFTVMLYFLGYKPGADGWFVHSVRRHCGAIAPTPYMIPCVVHLGLTQHTLRAYEFPDEWK